MQRNKIYKTGRWKKIREDVFKLDHYECVRCNKTFFDKEGEKKCVKPYLVHHMYPAKDFPQYQYSIWVNGKRNLVSLCFNCHEIVEGRIHNPKEHFTNEERYD